MSSTSLQTTHRSTLQLLGNCAKHTAGWSNLLAASLTVSTSPWLLFLSRSMLRLAYRCVGVGVG